MTEILRASDYEEYLGHSQWRIYKGHPRYCQNEQPHDPHHFRYVFRDIDGFPVRGSYWCPGEIMPMEDRPTEGETMIPIPNMWAEVRHAEGYDDDGHVTIWNERTQPEPIPPYIGVNGRMLTYTTIHAVYYDPTPVTPKEVLDNESPT